MLYLWDMQNLLIILPFLFSTIQAEDCSPPEHTTADLRNALSVSPVVDAETTPGSTLADNSFEAKGLRAEVFAKAKTAFHKAWEKGDTRKTTYTIIDYSLGSDKKRMWIIDMDTGELLYHQHVTHGKNSGLKHVETMSNVNNSKTSNIGLLKTGETYYGKHGLSLKLDGLEKGFNDNARSRYIVMHGASYATEAYVKARGRAGRSWGCPAIDPAMTKEIIHKLKGGTLLFGYYPDTQWLGNSTYLKED